jgi:hypothetical protein
MAYTFQITFTNFLITKGYIMIFIKEWYMKLHYSHFISMTGLMVHTQKYVKEMIIIYISQNN